MNLIQGLFIEMNRVSELIKEYESLPNGAGMIGAALMRIEILKAEKAITENDVLKLLMSYASLKEIESE